jgi:hypothetical protein
MIKNYLLSFTFLMGVTSASFAQESSNKKNSDDKKQKENTSVKKKSAQNAAPAITPEPIEPIYIHKKSSVGLGVGLMTFYGDINEGSEIYEMSNFRTALNLNIEQRFAKRLGVSVDLLYGKLSQNEHSIESNLNFESKVMQGNANFVFHLDNRDKGWRKTKVSSFLSAGVGYMTFNPMGDFQLEDGTTYYYWGDGSIRDQAFDSDNPQNGNIVHRDYIYETELDPSGSYSHGALVIPITLGIKVKFSNKFESDIKATYTLTQSDDIDNVASGGKDAYLFSAISFRYNILAKTPKLPDNSPFAKTNFDALVDNIDSDRDGIKDLDDKCGGTPVGARVDERGCPVDEDGDGIPNYQDKEKSTVKGNTVDANGVTIKDETLYWQFVDSIATPRDDLYKWRPSYRFDLDKTQGSETTNTGSKPGKMFITESVPDEYKYVDTNKDGIITPQEVNAAIDSFFESGSKDRKAEDLNRMVKYFSE